MIYDWDWTASERALKRSIDLAPATCARISNTRHCCRRSAGFPKRWLRGRQQRLDPPHRSRRPRLVARISREAVRRRDWLAESRDRARSNLRSQLRAARGCYLALGRYDEARSTGWTRDGRLPAGREGRPTATVSPCSRGDGPKRRRFAAISSIARRRATRSPIRSRKSKPHWETTRLPRMVESRLRRPVRKSLSRQRRIEFDPLRPDARFGSAAPHALPGGVRSSGSRSSACGL